MKVSFIVPVYNEIELTRICLETLEATLPALEYEVIVIDDGSGEPFSQQIAQLSSDRIKTIRSPRNRGFAAANNQGVYHAKGEILFLINNDLVFQPGWFEPMLHAFDRFKDLGIVGNVQLNAKTKEIDHAGYTIDHRCHFHHRRAPNRKGRLYTPAYTDFQMITGACCAIKKDAYLRHGGFDESYRNGCEDLDLCFRLSRSNLRILVANKSVIFHHVSATRGTEKTLQQERNFRLLQKRWTPEIRDMAAHAWAPQIATRILRNPATSSWHVAKDAARSIGTRELSKKGIAHAQSCLDRNNRHWMSTLDGLSDKEIKRSEVKKHHSWPRKPIEYEGLFTQSGHPEGVWLRDIAQINLPAANIVSKISLSGKLWAAADDDPSESGQLGLKLVINQTEVHSFPKLPAGDFLLEVEDPAIPAGVETVIEIQLLGTKTSNTLAYLGRICKKNTLIPQPTRARLEAYCHQNKNKRLMLYGLQINDESVLDFKTHPTSPLVFDYTKSYGGIGVNLVGWFDAELGIGESVRSAAKALKASRIDSSFVPLKANCLADRGDTSFAKDLSDQNPHAINIFHIDAAQSEEIDQRHGKNFRIDRYNIGYWAWELPELPDAWIKHFKSFDEIWCPSNFVRDAIAMKSPLPVVKIPHCIDFEIPSSDYRKKLDLPQDLFLFTFIYDLNSYQERKNPKAVIEAFKIAFLNPTRREKVGLVIKTQSTSQNPKEFALLQEMVKDLPHCFIIAKTLPRQDVYGLLNASDCYVSLHRSEGFGLTLAESMFLGKPVIATDWSATTEFLNDSNGLPVKYKLVELTQNIGPYQRGQIWADPDPHHAATHMRYLFENQAVAIQIGQRAAKTIRKHFSPQSIASLYEKRIKSISLW